MRADKIRAFILAKVKGHPRDIVDVTERHFGVSRTTVHRHIDRLLGEHKLIRTGAKKGARYYLPQSLKKQLKFKVNRHPEESLVWQRNLEESLRGTPEKIQEICNYAFGEMFNNAVDHSEGENILVDFEMDNEFIQIAIRDDGIGIFKKIQQHFNFSDLRESVLHLTKGKLTTAPDRHSGEGIFFTSRAVTEFELQANGLLYARNNDVDDWLLEEMEDKKKKGTLVSFKISLTSDTELEKVFAEFQNPDSLSFDRTQALVKLSKFKEERFISRSQAKRVLIGLEKFNHITLDFHGVKSVGQGFVDEVFRVFKNFHPEIEIQYINANDSVKFMIERGIATLR